jgi:hypothetical protein
MPPQRSILSSISGNRRFNYELSPYQRGIAISMSIKGAKNPEIKIALDYTRGALRSTFSLAELRDKGES